MTIAPSKLKGELAARWPNWESGQARRERAHRKLLIYREDHRQILIDHVEATMGAGEVSRYIKRFVTLAPNLCKAVTDQVAVSYLQGCTRELRGMTPDATKAFAQLVAESGIDRQQNGVNARSWLSGPVLCAPRLDSRNRLALDLANSDCFDIERERDYIDQALWYHQGNWIELTAESWNIYDQDGALVRVSPHAAAVCPAVCFTSMDNTDDYWSSSEHSGIVDATLLTGYKMAAGLYVRQVSGNKLTAVFADIDKLAEGQSLGHPALPILLPRDARIEVLDRIVSAKDYLDEISAIVSLAISAEGIPPGSVQMVGSNSDWGNLTVSLESGRLGGLRDRQVEHLRAHELNLWPLVVSYIRTTSHRLAGKLPPSDEVQDALRIQFPDLASTADQEARIRVMVAGLPYGLTNPVNVILAARTELTRAEAEEELKENLKVYIDLIEPLVSRNIPKAAPEANGAQTVAQEQGRIGGQASGEARSAAADTKIEDAGD